MCRALREEKPAAGFSRNNMNARAKTLVLNPLVGQHLKQYRIDGVIGQGGMGVVYRAQDLKLQRPVALKLLPTELTADAERRKRFIFEARAAARISHPAIAQVFDVDEENGTFFIAMEMVEGKTVRDLIANGQLDLLGTIDIALQVSAGLAKAHEAGIVHRDIKPANVIQTPEGHVKILDFGLAKLRAEEGITSAIVRGVQDLSTMTQTQIGIVKGTPAYMSPEQVKGEAVGARSDLFSLGVMMFEMATGKLPFDRATPTEIMHAIMFDQTPAIHTFRPTLPGDLQRIVARCLKKNPADRYPDARALMEDLRTLRRKIESGQARPPSFKERMSDTLGRFMHLKPAEYVWLVGSVVVLAFVIYLIVHRGADSLIALAIVSVFAYRFIRHQPRRVFEGFVRKVARVPEVRFIVCQDRQITVSVDRAAGQLYARINDHLSACNRKLFFGEPMSVVIRSDLTPEETRQWLSAPGVHYVRENAGQGN
jgi:serine/threonine protein kinase